MDSLANLASEMHEQQRRRCATLALLLEEANDDYAPKFLAFITSANGNRLVVQSETLEGIIVNFKELDIAEVDIINLDTFKE